jgi:hypothetical protein
VRNFFWSGDGAVIRIDVDWQIFRPWSGQVGSTMDVPPLALRTLARAGFGQKVERISRSLWHILCAHLGIGYT